MPPDGALPEADRERQRTILRIALAIALGLVFAEAQEEPFSFLTAMFAFQILIKMPQAPGLRQGVGFVLVIAVASGFALTLANTLQSRPTAYLLVLGLIIFGCFLAQLRGKGGPLPGMLLVCTAMVPVVAVVSPDLAQDFVGIMIFSAGSAVLLAWLAHAIVPGSTGAAAQASQPQQAPTTAGSVRAALACTIILMPAMIHYLSVDAEASIVVLITIVTVLSQRADMRGRAAFGLLLGNLIGGVLASIAYYSVALAPWLPFLFLVTLAAALVLAEGATRRRPEAGVFAVAMPTFLILLALGLTPITDGSGAAFISRFVDVALASLYALSGIILLLPSRGAASRRPRGAAA
jgi:hypothetical protein